MNPTEPLIWADDPTAPLARRGGLAISRAQYLADVEALAERLPAAGPMLNLTGDRYRFTVGLGAALRRGQDNLMPPNHTADTVARLRALFPSTYALVDGEAVDRDLPQVRHGDAASIDPGRAVRRDHITTKVEIRHRSHFETIARSASRARAPSPRGEIAQ